MSHLVITRSLATVALALGAFAAASAAHARSDVYFFIGVQTPGVHVHSAPPPVHVQPRPVYRPAPRDYGRYGEDWRYEDGRRHGGAQYYGQRRGPYGDWDRDGIANVYDPGSPRNQRRHARLHGPHGDLDRDGIRNQNDHDLDGDGIPNRFDRFPQNPYRW